ncbi:LlaJI family restriction endonuclease [Bacillus piscicola]|uniref:LlaJI family restriction endonuclease n=1 Tax=Bacillus piscicola TaxID=1632684 RepID=UPI001F08F876|nr:LlaJI family restriction endonuclease [Bacillus piscicola]
MSVSFFVEQKHYSAAYLKKIFSLEFLNLLKKKRVCLVVDCNEIKFQFVGLFFHKDKMYFVLPKYIRKDLSYEAKLRKAKIVLSVIKKYAANPLLNHNTIDPLIKSDDEEDISTFSLSKIIIEDFLQNGYYSKNKKIVQINGSGETLWGETVSEVEPYIINDSPHYFDTLTQGDHSDEEDVIIKIHKWAVNYCYEKYKHWLGYSHLDIEPLNIDISALGSLEFLINVIDNEMNVTYVDNKITTLKAIKSIIELSTDNSSFPLDAYGTRYFEHIWEKICSNIFDNKYKMYIKSLPKPTWESYDTGIKIEKESFLPDIISTPSIEGEDYFLILDAKYYHIRFENGTVKGNPSVNDISKQLLYEKGLGDIILDEKVRNYFLFPCDSGNGDLLEVFGQAKLDFISEKPVKLVYLADEKVYNMFLNNVSLSTSDYKELEINSVPQTNR